MVHSHRTAQVAIGVSALIEEKMARQRNAGAPREPQFPTKSN